jgi:hypothetical protein
MILYIETQAAHYPQTEQIISKFPRAEIVWIKHYKNLFDKNISSIVRNAFGASMFYWNSKLGF